MGFHPEAAMGCACCAMFVDVCRRNSPLGLCQNCVTYPPKPWVNTVIYGDTSTHIVVW